MGPITLVALLKLIIIAYGAAAVYTALLTLRDVINWFLARSNLKESDKDNLAFTLQEKLRKGDFRTVQGIFNPRTRRVIDGRAVHSHQIDHQLAALHRGEELVLYS